MAVRPRDSLLVLVTLATVIGASPLHSAVAGQAAGHPGGPNRWTTRGPGGGTILAMAVDPTDPSTIYAGAWDYYEPFGTGVYKSTDGGLHWGLANRGLTSTGVYSLAMDPVKTSTVYAGTQSGAIFKSTDGGTTWASIRGGIVQDEVHAIAIDPTDPETIYIAAQIHSYPPSNSLYRSTDGGDSWTPINEGLGAFTSIEALAIDPHDTATLYAGTDAGGVFKSMDGGSSWQKPSGDLDNTPYVSQLAIDPVTTSTIYATAYDYYGEYAAAVFKSTDGGLNWTPMTNGFEYGSRPEALAIDPSAPQTLYASAFNVDDYDSLGVYKTTDGGDSWTPMDAGLFPSIGDAIVIDPGHTGTVYVGMGGGGIFKTTDGAAHWHDASLGLLQAHVDSLAIDPSNSSVLYAGTEASGVFKSTNGGRSWVPINAGLPNSQSEGAFTALAVDPLDPITAYAGSWLDGLFKSADGGTSWTGLAGLPNKEVRTVAVDPAIEGTIYVGGGGALYKSVDGGQTFSTLTNGLPPFPDVYQIVFDPTRSSTIYASMYASGLSGVYKTNDGGAHWIGARKGLHALTPYGLAIDPSDPQTLYAGVPCTSSPYPCIFKTTNGGRRWAASSSGVTQTVNALAVDPASPSTVYAGTEDPYSGYNGQGVMRSTDGGSTWSPFDTGLRNLNVACMAIEPGGAGLHVGTRASGVWDYSVA